MSWIEPLSTIVTATSLANQLAKSSGYIRTQANRLYYWIKNGSAVIPIFGAGGVGKSILGRILGGADPLSIETLYDQSLLIEEVPLVGNVPGQILVAPGQARYIERHWKKLFAKLVAGRSFGLVNVVSYGFHSFQKPESFRDHDEYEKGMTAKKFIDKYTAVKRAAEIEFLKKLMDGLSAATRPFWMITLVNKQDLWWPTSLRRAVRHHYEKGEYGAIIADFERFFGKQSFQHEILPASLAISNFATPAGEILKTTASGYDLPTHLQYLQTALDKISDFVAQGIP